MRVIIAGIGGMGSYITKYLIEEGCDVTIIDTNVSKVTSMSDNESVAGIIGDVLSIDTLETAGIKNVDIFIATTNSDEVNILACQLAHSLGVKHNICEIQDFRYQTEEWQSIFRNKIIPIDDTISLGTSIIESILEQIKYSYLKISNILSFFNTEAKMFYIFCDENSSSLNKTVSSIYESISENIPFKIVGIQRNNNFNIAQDNDIIKENDRVFVVVQEQYIKDIYSLFFDLEQSENKFLESQSPNIIISGDHPFVKILAISLSKLYNRVKIITDSNNQSENTLIAMDLEKYGVQLIEDDITKDEYRNNYIKSEDDIIIVMNRDDHKSILKTLFLKHQSVGNLFCYLNDNTYENFLFSTNVNHIITPSNFIMSPILSHIRRGVIMKAYSLNQKAEIMELIVNENSKIIGKKINEIEEIGKFIVAMVINEKGRVLPITETTAIRSQYQLIIVVLRKYIPIVEENFLQNIDGN